MKRAKPASGQADGGKIPEIRFTITEKLDRLISTSSEELGVSKSEYIKSLVLRDLRACLTESNRREGK